MECHHDAMSAARAVAGSDSNIATGGSSDLLPFRGRLPIPCGSSVSRHILEDFRYATNGGTAFIVRRKGTPFGITCRHVLRGFSIDDLVITDARTGRKAAGIKGMYYPTNLRDENEGSDLDDICVIAFNELEGQFFDGAYDLDRQRAASSEPANQVIATGFLKQKSRIDPPNIFAGLGFLEFRDTGVAQFDHALRRGLATYANPDFDSIAGMSGSAG